LEARRRLERIISSVFDAPDRETVRTLRAIMALERIGSAEARDIVARIAQGAPGARETEEASALLLRLKSN
jgi:hypothetical protein